MCMHVTVACLASETHTLIRQSDHYSQFIGWSLLHFSQFLFNLKVVRRGFSQDMEHPLKKTR